MSLFQAARLIAAAMLFLAVFEMPGEYYKALRFVVVAAAIMEIHQIQKGAWGQGSKTAWILALAGIAIVFNPFLPMEMEREIWIWFDIGSILAFAGLAIHEYRIPIKALLVRIADVSSDDEKRQTSEESSHQPGVLALVFGMLVVVAFGALILVLVHAGKGEFAERITTEDKGVYSSDPEENRRYEEWKAKKAAIAGDN